MGYFVCVKRRPLSPLWGQLSPCTRLCRLHPSSTAMPSQIEEVSTVDRISHKVTRPQQEMRLHFSYPKYMSCLSTKEVNTRMSAAPATPHASRSAAQCRPPASTPRDIQVCSRRTMLWKRGPVQVTTPPQLKTQQNTRKYTRFLRLSQNIAPAQVTTPSQLKNQEKCWKTRQNQPVSKNVALCRSQLRHNLVTTSFTLGSRLAMHTGKKKRKLKISFFPTRALSHHAPQCKRGCYEVVSQLWPAQGHVFRNWLILSCFPTFFLVFELRRSCDLRRRNVLRESQKSCVFSSVLLGCQLWQSCDLHRATFSEFAIHFHSISKTRLTSRSPPPAGLKVFLLGNLAGGPGQDSRLQPWSNAAKDTV